MSAPDFLDTNILLYAYDSRDDRKQQIAQNLVRKALAGDGVTSMQALSEMAAALSHKISPPSTPERVLKLLDSLSGLRIFVTTQETVRRSLEFRSKYGIHFYDGLILAAAEQAGCSRIWSEDLNAGQKYFGIAVENPFA
jgi:predicted nucleic acid-binding protein